MRLPLGVVNMLPSRSKCLYIPKAVRTTIGFNYLFPTILHRARNKIFAISASREFAMSYCQRRLEIANSRNIQIPGLRDMENSQNYGKSRDFPGFPALDPGKTGKMTKNPGIPGSRDPVIPIPNTSSRSKMKLCFYGHK